MRKAPLKVGVSGSYGGMNLGDEAILTVILAELRKRCEVDVTVFSRHPDDTSRRHRVRSIPIQKLAREEARDIVRELDLLLVGGGGILYDGSAERYLREVVLAAELGVPAVLLAVGVGPLAAAESRAFVRDALSRAAAITVRDRASARVLEDLGVEAAVHVTADPALLLEPEPLPDDPHLSDIPLPNERLVGFSIREPGPAAPDVDLERYHDLLANTADFMVDRLDAGVVFVPMEPQHLDLQLSHAVVARMQAPQNALVLKGDYTSGQLLTLMSRFSFCLGMRLHFLIFAALQGVPFVALPYAPKVTGLIDELGLEGPPFDRVSAGQLIAHVDRSWDRRQAIRRGVAERLPALQGRARESIDLALAATRRRASDRTPEESVCLP